MTTLCAPNNIARKVANRRKNSPQAWHISACNAPAEHNHGTAPELHESEYVQNNIAREVANRRKMSPEAGHMFTENAPHAPKGAPHLNLTRVCAEQDRA